MSNDHTNVDASQGVTKSTVGAQIRIRREARGLTWEALGALSGVKPSHVKTIEEGACDPGLETIAALASALSCKLPDLFSPLESKSRAVGELFEEADEEIQPAVAQLMRSVVKA